MVCAALIGPLPVFILGIDAFDALGPCRAVERLDLREVSPVHLDRVDDQSALDGYLPPRARRISAR